MKAYQEQKFNIPELKGISQKNIEEHLKLYSGYVKHVNLILDHINELSNESNLSSGVLARVEKYSYELGELQRRFGFEFDGMRNHEYYFNSFEGGPTPIISGGQLESAIQEEWGSFENWFNRFKVIAATRGIGWAMLYYDKKAHRLVNAWIDEQHLGHLTGLSPVLALDMWEHSYVFDYQPSGKKKYIEDFFENLNWETIENNFLEAKK